MNAEKLRRHRHHACGHIQAELLTLRSNQLQVIERDRLARATEIIEDIAICVDENDDSQPLLDYLPTELSDRIAAFLNGSALDSTTGDERG